MYGFATGICQLWLITCKFSICHVLGILSIEKAFHLNEVASVLGRVQKMFGHFKKSSKATYSLREKQRLRNTT